MGCRTLRIFSRRFLKKAIPFGIVITTFYCTWRLYYLVWCMTPFLENNENDIRNFQEQWCRMQRWRVDWEMMIEPCVKKVAWDQRKADSEWRTDASKSFIKKWEIQPAGHFSRFFIQSVARNGVHKNFGGDAWRVYIRQGPASLAPQVWDHDNGKYEVVFLVMEPGNYSAKITLDFTLCDGFREPPVDWFVKGTVQGKYQPDGILGYIGDDYILEPIERQAVITFSVPETSHNTKDSIPGCSHFESTESRSIKTATTCGITCTLLQDGFGRWVDGLWLPYIEDNKTVAKNSLTRADTLWIYGDSVAQNFLRSLKERGICKKNFKKCKDSYLWIYELTSVEEAKSKFGPNDFNKTVILQYLTKILDSPDMRNQNSVFLFNLGVHYPISLNFTTYKDLVDSVIRLLRSKVEDGHNNKPILIWKTTTSIEKEKTHLMFAELPRNKTHWRFHTHQRLELFHKYGTHVMCKAGIPVLDVYSMTASYPNGTLDHVHYNENAQRAAEDQLLTFVMEKIKKTPT